MTNEEAIEILQKIKPIPHRGDGKSITHTLEIIAIDMAIKALEQQSCEDCISRHEVFDVIERELFKWDVIDEVRKLPLVTPKAKTGQWLMPQQDDGMSDPIYYQVRCSKCGFDLDPQTWHMELHQYGADKYCPNCGAKMQEVEE